MGYWWKIAKRAAKASARDLKLDSWVAVMNLLLVQGVIALGIFLMSGPLVGGTLWGRILTAAAPFLVFPVVFLVRMITEPAALQKEQEVAIANAGFDNDKVAIREKLGEFLSTGSDLLVSCQNGTVPVDKTIPLVDAWCAEVCEYLQANLDSSYSARFLNATGPLLIPLGEMSQEHRNLWNWLHDRVETMRTFIQENL